MLKAKSPGLVLRPSACVPLGIRNGRHLAMAPSDPNKTEEIHPEIDVDLAGAKRILAHHS